MKPNDYEKDEVREKQFDLEVGDGELTVHPRVKKSQKPKKGGWQFISLAGELGFDIALPMVLGLVIGEKIDAVRGTHPKATLVSLGIGFVIACASLIRIVLDAQRKR